MRAALLRSCTLGVVVAACAVLAGPALADPSTPVGLTATARSDHRVDLTWSWPADPTYPDELDVLRDNVFIGSANPASATSFEDDLVATPGTTHSYQLVPVTDGVGFPPTASTSATVRADLPNAPTNIAVTIAPVTNIATVTWTRGALDSDVTYTVTAQQDPGSPIISRTARYSSIGTSGSLTVDGLASYTSYLFKVSAVEDVGDPPGDPGGTTQGASPASVVARTNDILAPQFNSTTLNASRSGLGTISATWTAASDSGSGVVSYLACVDAINCTSVPYEAFSSSQTATPGAPNVPNDGGTHTVTVVAVDGAGNQSAPITNTVVMPVPGTPLISLQGGDGCAPLVAGATSVDGGTSGLVYHLFVNGVASDSLLGQQITGTPYSQVTLTAKATYGGDSSAVSPPLVARIFDPDGPAASPQVHGQADQASSTETLFWDPVTATGGAPVDGYQVTSSTAPGYQGVGVFVPQSSAPGVQIKGLAQSDGYTVNVVTVDHCGRYSPPPDVPFHFRVSDNVPPSPPVLNPPTSDGHNIFLSWTPSSDNVAVDDYRIYRGTTLVGRTPGTTFEDTNLPDATTFNYYVVATDTAGNASARSTVAPATTKDLTPPSRPGVPTCQPSGGTNTLKWGASSDNVKVAGYRVSRGGTIIATVTNGTTYVDKAPADDYVWSVQAFDAAGNVSTVSTCSGTSYGSPKATAASALKVVKSKGVLAVQVGGKSGARLVLSFTLTQPFTRAVLHLHVLSGKAKVRISLPAGSGRTTPGKRLGVRAAKKGILKVPIGTQKSGTLRLVVTAQGGLVKIAGKGGAKSPTIMNAS